MQRLLALVLFFVSSTAWTTSGQVISFQRGANIWVAKANGTGAKKIGPGSAPRISPNGTRVAFQTNGNASEEIERLIAVADLRTGKTTVFKTGIPSTNCQAATWSPNGKKLLFSIFAESDWHLALVDAGGSDFRYVIKASPKNNSFWSACWAPDGKSIYAQDLSQLYQFDLKGRVLKSWKLASLFPDGNFSSGSRMDVSPDGKKLLMAVDMDEEVASKDRDGSQPSLWVLDLAGEKISRLTPSGMSAWDGCWLGSDEVLFVSEVEKEKYASIFQMSVAEKTRKPFIKNAEIPSISR